MDSDIEHDSDDGLPNVKAWGKKKSVYFGTDYVDKDFRKRAGQDEEELAQQEEEEAKAIQMRILEEIREDDLDLNKLPDVSEERDETIQKVQIDIDSLSKREKLQLLKKEAPELTSLIEDFKNSLEELEKAKTMLNTDQVGGIDAYQPSLPYQIYKTKFNLLTRYCMNISFYLLLKSKGKSIGNHPVASNLLNLKKMILTIEKLEKIEKNVDYGDLREKDDDVDDEDEDEDYDEDEDNEDDDLENEEDQEELKGISKSGKTNQLEMDEDELVRRPINYQISKNKGLTPKKPKEQRNPRVKHRMKYKKAKARRRGQVREVRKEIKKYAGEISGIRTTTVKSVKFK